MEECPICYDDTVTLNVLKCLHTVCKPCISKLIKRLCPLCRTPIDEEGCISTENIEINFDTENMFFTEEIYSLELDVRHPTRRARRRRTRDRNREVQNIINQIFSIPINLSMSELNISDNEDEDDVENEERDKTSKSDNKKQLCKHKRNRWRLNNNSRVLEGRKRR